jgi:hypothetical protein
VRLVDLTNADGGVDGRPIQLDAVDGGRRRRARRGRRLADRGQDVLGSYGSTSPSRRRPKPPGGMLSGDRRRRFDGPPRATGSSGSRRAVSCSVPPRCLQAQRLAPMFGRAASSLRFAVANVDGVYGTAVADGAVRGSPPCISRSSAGSVRRAGLDAATVVRRIAAVRPDALRFRVRARRDALRRQMVRQRLRLVSFLAPSATAAARLRPDVEERCGRSVRVGQLDGST